MKRADPRAAFDRWDSLGRGLGDETDQRRGTGCRHGRPVCWSTRNPHPVADLVFSGTLYVDMVPEEVPVPVGLFLVCRGRMPDRGVATGSLRTVRGDGSDAGGGRFAAPGAVTADGADGDHRERDGQQEDLPPHDEVRIGPGTHVLLELRTDQAPGSPHHLHPITGPVVTAASEHAGLPAAAPS